MQKAKRIWMRGYNWKTSKAHKHIQKNEKLHMNMLVLKN